MKLTLIIATLCFSSAMVKGQWLGFLLSCAPKYVALNYTAYEPWGVFSVIATLSGSVKNQQQCDNFGSWMKYLYDNYIKTKPNCAITCPTGQICRALPAGWGLTCS